MMAVQLIVSWVPSMNFESILYRTRETLWGKGLGLSFETFSPDSKRTHLIYPCHTDRVMFYTNLFGPLTPTTANR